MLLKSFPSITLPDDQWVDLNTLLGIPVGTALNVSNSGSNGCYVYVNNVAPTANTDGYLINRVADTTQDLDLSSGVEIVWVRGKGAILNVNTVSLSEPPAGVYEGTRAVTVQGYEEANIKLGIQFEGSKNFGELAGGTVLNTIFRTGKYPVSLKRRLVSFTGTGVTGEIYQNPTFTGGTQESYQNATTISPEVGLSQIIVNLSTLTDDGTLAFAPVHAFGNTSNQGKGGVLTLVEPEHILAPNTDFLLRLTSLDSNPQTIASHIVWYEGELDLPRP